MNTPVLIYMDQFVWIELARRHLNPSQQPSRDDPARTLLLAIEGGDVVCPLSSTHVIETGRRISIRSRRDVIRTMVTFSRGWFLAPGTFLTSQEIRHSLARLFGAPAPLPIVFLGRGLPFAFGRSGQLHKDLDMPVEKAELFELVLDGPKALFHLLGGTDNAYIEPTRSALLDHAHSVTGQEEQDRGFQKRFSEAERKRAYAAKLTLALHDELATELDAIGRTMAEFLALGHEKLMEFWASVPTADVEIQLVTARNKQWSRRIDENDILDIDFLTTAIPYCDLVLTEAFWNQLSSQSGLPEKYGTTMATGLDSITDFLHQLQHPR